MASSCLNISVGEIRILLTMSQIIRVGIPGGGGASGEVRLYQIGFMNTIDGLVIDISWQEYYKN